MTQPAPGPASARTPRANWRSFYAADLFAWSGMALYALYLVGCLSALIPPRLLDPRWLQVAISALIANGMFPVIGTCLLVLAGSVDPDDPPGQFWLRLFRRWAWIGVLGYLLLIPLQAYTTVQLDRAADAPLLREISGLDTAIRDVKASRSLAQLGPALAKLPGAPAIPQGFDVPFERFQPQVLDTLTTNQIRLKDLRVRQALQRRAPQISGVLHTTLSCLILASVFAAAAQAWENQPSLLRQALTRGLRLRDRQAVSRRTDAESERRYIESIIARDDS